MAGVQISPDAATARTSDTVLLGRNDFPRKSVGGHISVVLIMSKIVNLFVILEVKCLSDLFP